MRLTELWEGRCLCGAEVSTASPAFVCRKCGSHGRFERPECQARITVPPDETLSAREEAA